MNSKKINRKILNTVSISVCDTVDDVVYNAARYNIDIVAFDALYSAVGDAIESYVHDAVRGIINDIISQQK